ncbi:MAG: putative quinol monooxygenase [Caldimonas sp.]
MVHVMASIVVKPEHAAAAKALLITLAGKSRHEAGCISYEVFQRADAAHVFQTVEEWQGQADVDAHMKTPHVAEVLAAAGPMLASPPAIVSYAKIG